MAVHDIERELEVLAVFRQLLQAPALGPEQNFFEAGGSSLLASRLAAKLRSTGVLDVPTSAIFAAPSARALTRYAHSASLPLVEAAATPRSTPATTAADRGARQRGAFARLRAPSSAVLPPDVPPRERTR